MRYMILVCWICLLLTSPLGQARAEPRPDLVDAAGRKVSPPVDPARIVCLGPGCLRLVVYLQALDKVVGVEGLERRMGGRPYYLAQRRTLDRLPVVSPGGPAAINRKPDLESILRVKPQVVFVTYMEAALADEVQALLGTPVVVLTYGRLAAFDERVYDSLRLAGRILDRTERAEEVIGLIEAGREDLLRRVRGLDEAAKPLAYVGGIGFRGAHGLESTDSLYIPFTWLKARNAAAGLSDQGHLMIDKERLLLLQPGVLFVDGGGLELARSDFGRKPAFYRSLKAVREGRVHLLYPYNWYATNIGTALADAFAIGRILHPDRFRDLDPVQKADQIYASLVGRPVYRDMAGLYGPLGGRPGFLK